MSEAADFLFVYGTLMRGLPLHHLLDGRAAFVAAGSIIGRLMDLGDYPGALPEGFGAIRGELYQLRSQQLLAELDSVEGPEFPRSPTLVRLDDGRELRAWVYWFTGSLRRAAPVRDGDYRRHLALTTSREEQR